MYPIIGFVVCMVLFMVIQIPMQYIQMSLSVVVYTYIVALMSVGIWGIVKVRNKEKIVIKLARREFIIWTCIVLVQLVFLHANMVYGSTWDTGDYIGQISTAVYTDTMRQYEPFSGKKYATTDWYNLFAAYEMHSAAMCKLFNIHPLIYVHRVLATFEIVFYNIVLYNISLLLLKNNKMKSCIALISIFAINMSSYSLFSLSGFLFLRAGESKSMLCAVILPLILYWFVYILKNNDKESARIMYLLTVVMGVGISKSGAFVIPVALSLLMLPVILVDKKNILALYLMCMFPCILMLLYQAMLRI